MAEEFHVGSGNWWDTSRNSFGWPSTEMADMKSTSTASGSGSPALHGGHDQSSGGAAGGILANPDSQIIGLGLSSQGMDWNQALFRDEGGFRSMLHEDMSSNNSSVNDFKQMNRVFSTDQPHFSRTGSNDSTIITSQNLTTSFPADSASAYGFLLSDQNQQPDSAAYERQPTGYPNAPSGGYGVNTAESFPSWNKFPQFPSNSTYSHLANNNPLWNTSAAMTDARSSFHSALKEHIPLAPSFDEKPKRTSDVRNLSTTTKKNCTETSNKRPRSETPSPLPAFKVRKEKMGDRITALQQLVSPFGKTDTASVLSESIEYIKFLHEQISALSAPYMKNGNPIQHQQALQSSEKSKDEEGRCQDLRSRGLCLVPVSSTFPVTHEATVDFWTPTFGGSFR